MPQRKILLDTNAYLRLAQTIRPLLGKSFGKENFTLYIHKRFDEEISKSPRLKSKFYWVNQNEYVQNRKKKLQLSNTEKEEIEFAFNFIWEYQNEFSLGLSRVDIYCVATALTLDIPLVTDDKNMIRTCREYDVEVFSTLRLLKLMLEKNFIDFNMINEIVEYWKYENDLPISSNEFQKLFRTFFNTR